ncbi:hypothetical protein [Nostoc sp.]|uniref:hypothetical protein n=1 Tax=Nostoc sp. TaxID=1180 RepID=UPI002FF809D7
MSAVESKHAVVYSSDICRHEGLTKMCQAFEQLGINQAIAAAVKVIADITSKGISYTQISNHTIYKKEKSI